MAGGGQPEQLPSTTSGVVRKAAPWGRLAVVLVALTALGTATGFPSMSSAGATTTGNGATTTTSTRSTGSPTTTTTAVTARPTTTTTGSSTTTTAPSTTTTTTAIPGTSSPPPAPPAPSAPSDVKAIRAEQAALLTQVHQPAIDLAGRALGVAQSAVTSDQLTLQADRAQAAAAAFAAAATRDRRATDLATLALAAARNHVAQGRLALDRDRLRGFALGVYTGALTGPQSPAVESLSSEQQADVGRREAAIIAQVVIADLNSDVDAAATAGRQYRQAQDTIGADQHELAVETNTAATAAARIPPDLSALAADQHQLATAQRRRQRVHADLTVALTAVVGPPALRSSGLSVLGMSALDGAQLAGWYNAQGYTDLTAASITQLASWYIQSGVAEGVRGDVAFAQAVLETGGFSSPDAVALNNYAGIGHCDSCAAGWPFPSPQTGVIGHLQLLRIFATAAPAPRRAPAPVLAALAPAHQSRRGCCPDWESLTGVWATDPLYAVSILSLYQSMLAFAATAGVPTVPSASQTSPAGSQPPSSGSQPPPSGSQPPPSSGGQASPAGSQPPPSGTQPPPASTTTTSPTTIPAPPSTT